LQQASLSAQVSSLRNQRYPRIHHAPAIA
jgi:hypothetical protein